jgi:hypothetical protein
MSEKLKNIEGAQSRIPYVRRSVGNTKYNYLDYSDVNNFVFKTKRHTSTLDPIYIFKKKEDLKKSFFHGPIEKSKPTTNYPYYYKPSLNLKTDDIKGSNPGSINYINKFKGNDANLNISDIHKTNSGSLKKGITTTRCINPLIPKYQYLGEREEKMRDMDYEPSVFEHIEDLIILIAFLAAIFLKMLGVINIPWIWIFSPIWLLGGLVILFILFAILVGVITLIIDKIKGV